MAVDCVRRFCHIHRAVRLPLCSNPPINCENNWSVYTDYTEAFLFISLQEKKLTKDIILDGEARSSPFAFVAPPLNRDDCPLAQGHGQKSGPEMCGVG